MANKDLGFIPMFIFMIRPQFDPHIQAGRHPPRWILVLISLYQWYEYNIWNQAIVMLKHIWQISLVIKYYHMV